MKPCLAGLTALALLTAGCATTTDESYAVPALHKQASFDFNCPQDQLQISQLGEHKYGVEGCHHKAAYLLQSCDAMSRECTFAREEPPA